MTSPTRSHPHWFNEVQEDITTGCIPIEEENVPGILLWKKINGDMDEYHNCFGKRMRAPSHPSNLELLTTVSMNDQSFILSYLVHRRLLVLSSGEFNSEEVKSLELVIGRPGNGSCKPKGRKGLQTRGSSFPDRLWAVYTRGSSWIESAHKRIGPSRCSLKCLRIRPEDPERIA
jgi:hypothetical protein